MRLDRTQTHTLIVAFLGRTADHLLDVHGITPAGDWRDRPEGKRENAAAHLAAHRRDLAATQEEP